MKADFFDHYIDQLISEECINELIGLRHEYKRKQEKIEENRTVRDGVAFDYERRTGNKIHNTPRNELIQLEKEYKDKAKQIAVKHAKVEKKLVLILKETEPEKTVDKKLVDKKSQVTEKNFEDVQKKMIDKANLHKQITFDLEQRDRENKAQEKPSPIKEEPDINRDKKEHTQSALEEKNEMSKEELKALLRQQLTYEIKQRDGQDQYRGR